MKETKRERFVRVSEKRTQKVLDALRSLGKCSAQVSYEYTYEEVEQIFSAIEREVQRIRAAFSGLNRFTLSAENRETIKAGREDTPEDVVSR